MIQKPSRRIVLAGSVAIAAAMVVTGATAQDTPGVTDTTIKIGHINPYSGPASAYSQIGYSIEAYFNKVNEEGGVNGRTIEFISYDDGYAPPKTVEQARRLVESDEVFLIFQPLGTPPNSAIHQYMNDMQVPQLFVATGASKWGDPENFPWTMGWQPDYITEGKIYANYILENHPDGKIGILYQNDDYGKDYVDGLREGLGDKADEMIVAELSYEVADPTVDSQVINLKASGADIFYNVTTPKFAAQSIKKAAEIDWQPVHLLNSVSNSVGAVLAPAGLDVSKGVISASYLKDPADPQWAEDQAVIDWRAFMDEYYPDGDQNSSFTFYGYTVAQALIHVLEQAGDDLSRENVMKAAASMTDVELPMLLPGITMNTSDTDFYPLQQMQLIEFDGERWELFGDVIAGS